MKIIDFVNEIDRQVFMYDLFLSKYKDLKAFCEDLIFNNNFLIELSKLKIKNPVVHEDIIIPIRKSVILINMDFISSIFQENENSNNKILIDHEYLISIMFSKFEKDIKKRSNININSYRFDFHRNKRNIICICIADIFFKLYSKIDLWGY